MCAGVYCVGVEGRMAWSPCPAGTDGQKDGQVRPGIGRARGECAAGREPGACVGDTMWEEVLDWL